MALSVRGHPGRVVMMVWWEAGTGRTEINKFTVYVNNVWVDICEIRIRGNRVTFQYVVLELGIMGYDSLCDIRNNVVTVQMDETELD